MSLALGVTAAGLAVAGAGQARAVSYSSLAEAFDSTSISADTAPSAADFDGAGASLSATDLDNAGWTRGSSVTVNGTTYSRPDVAPGRPDNVQAAGQTVRVSGSGNALGFLAAAAHGPVSADGTITYSDNSSSGYTLSVDDWRSGSASTAAVTLGHANSPAGQQTGPVRLYAVTVPLTPGKTVASVTLPTVSSAVSGSGPALHVYSVALRGTPAAPGGKTWSGSWAASFGSAPPVPQNPDWRDQTLRMVVHPHTSGSSARIRFANTYSPTPVRFGHTTVAPQKDGATAAQAPVSLTFGGSRQVTVPAGGEVFSDPVPLPVTAGRNLLVSVYLPGPVTAAPLHEYALTTSYTTSRLGGDHSADSGGTSFPGTFDFWTYLSGIDVATVDGPGTIVALGDSQTDGAHSTKDTNRRWPDRYADLLNARPAAPGVLNSGISANQLLNDRTSKPSSVSGLNRLDRDVFSQTNVRTLVLYEGINDITCCTGGNAVTADQLKAGVTSVATQARARGLRVVVATIPAFGGADGDYNEDREDVRQAVNAYIRTTTDIDSYVDFDLATRDPDLPNRLRAGIYDSDHLHFNDAGTKVLADTLAAGSNSLAPNMSQTTVADFDGDHVADLVAREDATGSLKLWRGRGDETFGRPTLLTGWRDYSQTVAADFTGDGKADLVARNAAGSLLLWAGDGNGSFARPVSLTTGWDFTQTTAADFDGDGKADLIAKDSAGNLRIWAGRGDGTFGSSSILTGGWNFTQTTAGDYNGDGQADIMARDTAGNLKLWTHRANGTFSGPTQVTGGWNFTQTATGDVTKDGRADLVARDDTTGTLKMWSGNGDATFSSAHDVITGW
ncbi:FG-GAP-like repeat-containing protein [Streptomyces sp. NPDC056670]|uniref:FG-GAP-like repeat-containing protein n=1 Tax=Streptomyces sp. NPDC056670 TaxID=3345904 RepID=UPI00369A7D6F